MTSPVDDQRKERSLGRRPRHSPPLVAPSTGASVPGPFSSSESPWGAAARKYLEASSWRGSSSLACDSSSGFPHTCKPVHGTSSFSVRAANCDEARGANGIQMAITPSGRPEEKARHENDIFLRTANEAYQEILTGTFYLDRHRGVFLESIWEKFRGTR